MIETRDQVEEMIHAGFPLHDIERRIDEMPVDEEARAALWLRAYASQPGFLRLQAIEESWRRTQVTGE